jgi:carbamoyl-phosphate synthase large subunit
LPKRTDLKKVMIIGSGAIAIGSAAEFDFSTSQAIKALREEGFYVVLANDNPATIQTDLGIADRTYMEPLDVEFLEKIIEKERPQGIISGMGGQMALNLCSELHERGILQKYSVELLGTSVDAIRAAEDREAFRQTMKDINEPIPLSASCNEVDEAIQIATRIGYPVIIRAAYTLGGLGSGIAESQDQLVEIVTKGLAYSRIHQVLVEECVLGWKEFEYEVMRDGNDNCITICNMENFDPMGIHTGESIVIAPAQTLSDEDNQMLRTSALKIIRALGIRGGCNIQFALNQYNGEYRVIEVNPRVSRSSALASKATGYPIARVAAKIVIGMNLDEIPNRVTGETKAEFEPTLDYCVLKIPRWPFDKLTSADPHIGTQMKSTGEVMAIGRTIEEAIMKAIRSLDIKKDGLISLGLSKGQVMAELIEPTDKRIFAIGDAIRKGLRPETIADITKWDVFFVDKIAHLVEMEEKLKHEFSDEVFTKAKRLGFPDSYIARLTGRSLKEITALRKRKSMRPTFKMVDTCGAEFAAKTPYFYSTWESECEGGPPTGKDAKKASTTGPIKRVIIIGSGSIRIGQGVEFDECSVNGIMALKEEGVEAIVINNNPETVSTDFDVSDRLYFEPLTLEDVVNVIEEEDPDGIVLQYGGQTAINLAIPLQRYFDESGSKCKVLGTSADSIDLAEDRKRFDQLMEKHNIPRPEGGTGMSYEEVKARAHEIGYPVLVRPSYVLGGRGMEIVYAEEELEFYMKAAAAVNPDHPVLVDKYLTNAIEIDVDAVCDGKDVFIGAIQEHIEQAGVHSGDASCVIPTQTLSEKVLDEIRRITRETALHMGVLGLVNLQLAVKDDIVYMLEANPRASRTVPYVSKSTGIPLAKVATKVMLGKSLKDQGLLGEAHIGHASVKSPVFPFLKLPGVDAVLGPEMKSTGEVIGVDKSFHLAYYKAMLASGMRFPTKGKVYITVRDSDKDAIIPIAQELVEAGLELLASVGTATYLREHGVQVKTIWRISEGKHPDAIDLMRKGEIKLVINTPTKTSGARRDGYQMRRLAVELEIPFLTTLAAARAAAKAIKAAKTEIFAVKSINEYVEESGAKAKK